MNFVCVFSLASWTCSLDYHVLVRVLDSISVLMVLYVDAIR